MDTKLSNHYDVIVCGSGPAGLSASLESVRAGKHTLLVEKMLRPACKLYATGGGRCNFSNILPPDKFMLAFGRSGRFMSEALAYTPREWVFQQLKENGVEPVLEDGIHYFPASGHASDVIAAFLHPARALGLDLLCSTEVTEIVADDGRISEVRLSNGEAVRCGSLILACGGTASGRLGGCDAGLRLAKSAGHTIIPPVAAMAPLLTDEVWPGTLAGTTLERAGLSFGSGRNQVKTNGILLFTKEGISGPAALDISGPAHRALLETGKVVLNLTFDLAVSEREWMTRLELLRKEDPKKFTRSSLAAYFTHATANAICAQAVDSEIRNGAMSNSAIMQLAKFLTAAPLTVTRPCPMEKAMAMNGGVSLKEVDPRTMESRLLKGMFFAGEILDLTGPCGGFNIQFALSSGRLAGASAAV